MAMNKHKQSGNGGVVDGVGGSGEGVTPSGMDSQTDLLAGLELGKKSSVSCFFFLSFSFGEERAEGYIGLAGEVDTYTIHIFSGYVDITYRD